MIVNDNNGRTVFRTERVSIVFLLCYFFLLPFDRFFFLFIFCSKHSRTRKKNKIKNRIIAGSFRRTNISIETNREKTVRRLLGKKITYALSEHR